jgi:hypothetical protein
MFGTELFKRALRALENHFSGFQKKKRGWYDSILLLFSYNSHFI